MMSASQPTVNSPPEGLGPTPPFKDWDAMIFFGLTKYSGPHTKRVGRTISEGLGHYDFFGLNFRTNIFLGTVLYFLQDSHYNLR